MGNVCENTPGSTPVVIEDAGQYECLIDRLEEPAGA